MYANYFGFVEAPFSIAPDPRYLFLSDKHREALAHLLYGVGDQGGFILLTGEVGTGKTTVCRCLLQQLPADVDAALILNPKQNSRQLLQSICNEFGILYNSAQDSDNDLIDRLNSYLLEQHGRGRNSILIIDEAQNLSSEVLEQLRLLTNLETNEKKLLQLVLLGQPELNDLLARQELRQLGQRITARYHLTPLSRDEVRQYIEHRLTVAGCRRPLFKPRHVNRIYRYTKGIPRLINLVCDRALLGAYASDKSEVDNRILRQAAREVFAESPRRRRPWVWLVTGAVLLLAAGLVWWLRPEALVPSGPPSVEAPATVAPPEPAQPEPAAPDAVTRLLAAKGQADFAAQMRALAALWPDGAKAHNLPETPAQCPKRQGDVLSCRRFSGDFETLLAHNRPALLRLRSGADEAQRYVLVAAADTARATVRLPAGDEVVLTQAQLARLWDGTGFLLWRLPTPFQLPVRAGDDGPEVAWLNRQLTSYYPHSAERWERRELPVEREDFSGKYDYLYAHYLALELQPLPPVFGPDLLAMVRRFQGEQGLEADGVVDVATLAALNRQLHPDTPRLNSGAESRS